MAIDESQYRNVLTRLEMNARCECQPMTMDDVISPTCLWSHAWLNYKYHLDVQFQDKNGVFAMLYDALNTHESESEIMQCMVNVS